MSEFDIIVYGATGYTGRLVAEYLGSRNHGVRWAMSGRSQAKLEQVRDELGLPDQPIVVADADNPESLRALCEQTTVVLSTVGPYQLYGGPLVAACAAKGTGYVDLCGEPAWMRQMIDAYEADAKASGARIVFSCGFDSIPFDLGVWTVQNAARARFGRPAPRVKGRVTKMQGTFSGGTFASARATMAAAARDPQVLKLMIDPFALTPGFTGPSQPKGLMPEYDDTLGAWTAPFVMAAINTKNVHRTNALTGHAYGTDLRYDEMVAVPGLGDVGRMAAEAVAKLNPLGGDKGPALGDGPTRTEREAGHYEIKFLAEMPDGERVVATVTGDRDPGYGSTSKMIAEAAICLVKDVDGAGGIWTPGALMPEPLVKRLEANAGVTFRMEG
ncbi:Uncharacterized conserved protein [Sphingomonas guangdongensis]|uniref:Uncharacterized conserved protein n=1 Tax=Sphingomonas guangdongensis TaxID=1141890 RepID=A0A285QBY2_9SPHN|nr:saccharopine dehydrogenase NADP-binding domain-containing protein [Sphingomonas guangdongensis]SOB79393.1 Uncharacterized conserved protein [Sphingomonas guangdongensis]